MQVNQGYILDIRGQVLCKRVTVEEERRFKDEFQSVVVAGDDGSMEWSELTWIRLTHQVEEVF